MTEKENKNSEDESIKRLNALIRLSIEREKIELGRSFNLGDKVRQLSSVGLAPSEIAKILGKKSSSDIAPYLYIKKKNENKIQEAEKNE